MKTFLLQSTACPITKHTILESVDNQYPDNGQKILIKNFSDLFQVKMWLFKRKI